jgi:hypothetical protein
VDVKVVVVVVVVGGEGFSNILVAEDPSLLDASVRGNTGDSRHAELSMSPLLIFYRCACLPVGFSLLTSRT